MCHPKNKLPHCSTSMKTFLFIMVFFFSSKGIAQSEKVAIDAALTSLEQKHVYASDQSIANYSKVLKQAEKAGYNRAIIECELKLAKKYFQLGMFEQAFKNISKCKAEAQSGKYIDLYAETVVTEACLEYELGNKSVGMQEIFKAIDYVENVPDDKFQNSAKGVLFIGATEISLKDLKYDDAYKYCNNAITFLKAGFENQPNLAKAYTLLADFHLAEKNFSDAVEAHKKAKALATESNSSEEKLKVAWQFAKISQNTEAPETVETAYQVAIKFAKENQYFDELRFIYSDYSKWLQEIDIQKSQRYNLLQSKLLDSLQFAKNASMGKVYKKIVEQNTVYQEQQQRQYFRLLTLGILLILACVASIFFIYKRLKKDDKEKKETLQKLSEQQNKLEVLNQQVNHSLEKLLKYARSDDPTCVAAANRQYPEFFKKLLEIEPDLSEAEQKFCLYIKLQFSTKDIAEFYETTTKAIQNKKSRIRKRLHIAADENIYQWMENLV